MYVKSQNHLMVQQALVSSSVPYSCLYLTTDRSAGLPGLPNLLEMMEGGIGQSERGCGGVETRGNGACESYPSSPNLDILACPMGMLPLVSGLYTIYTMYIEPQMQS